MKNLIIILVISAVILFKSCSYLLSDMCANQVHSETTAPDNSLKAVTFQRDCGATTGFSTQISIINEGSSLPNEKGNVFIISGHPRDAAPEITWLQDSSGIIIHHELDGSEFLSETAYGWLNKVTVEYKASGS